MRTVAYLTNEHPLYLKMTLNSVRMVRRHNPDIPVRVFLISDGTTQTVVREATSCQDSFDPGTTDVFRKACEEAGADVLTRDPIMLPGEERFFHINRKYLADLTERDVLYIDADTFVFGDIARVFDEYSFADFAACKADWAVGRGWSDDFLAKPVGPFSSGVMLWNNGSIRDWCDLLPTYLAHFRRNETPLAHWLHQLHSDCLLREEFSVTKHISESNLTHTFIEHNFCHLIRSESCLEELGRSLIFHSYTPNWKKAYNRIYRPKRKVAFGKVRKDVKGPNTVQG